MWQGKKGLRRGILGFLLFLFLFPVQAQAAQKGYFENPEEIYERFRSRIYNTEFEVKYGFARESFPVYSDPYGSSQVGKGAKYSGIIAVSQTESYVQVIYETKKGYAIGWMERGQYKEIVRFYNGEEKQLLADGTYRMTSKMWGKEYEVALIFQKNQQYKIQNVSNGTFLGLIQQDEVYQPEVVWTKEEESESQCWILVREYDHFYLKNKISGQYLDTGRERGLCLFSLEQEPENIFGQTKKEQGPKEAQWIFERTGGTNVSPYRNFLQYDPDWARKDYGNVHDYSGKMAAAGCGVVAITNAVYALNGQFIDPMLLAEYAVEKNYRIIGSGTDDGIFQAAAQKYGEAYDFYYLGKTYDVFQVRDCIKQGCIVISHVPGHYVTIADYNEKKEKYLVLDSHPIPARPTGPFGNWFSWNRLESGGLASSCYYVYSANKTKIKGLLTPEDEKKLAKKQKNKEK